MLKIRNFHELVFYEEWDSFEQKLLRAKMKNSRSLKQLLRKDKKGRLLIHLAVRLNAPSNAIKILLEMFPEFPRIKDGSGKIPLHYAVLYASPEVVKSLVELYPEGILCRDNEGITPLSIASPNDAEMLQTMVKLGKSKLSEAPIESSELCPPVYSNFDDQKSSINQAPVKKDEVHVPKIEKVSIPNRSPQPLSVEESKSNQLYRSLPDEFYHSKSVQISPEEPFSDIQRITGFQGLGRCVSISDNGMVVASGGIVEEEYLYVKVYERLGGTFKQRGQSLKIEMLTTIYNLQASMISLSGDGNLIAIGWQSIFCVDVFAWNGIEWKKHGSSLSYEDGFNSVCSLSGDGMVICVGHIRCKRLCLFRWNSQRNDWEAMGSPIDRPPMNAIGMLFFLQFLCPTMDIFALLDRNFGMMMLESHLYLDLMK